MKGTRAFVLIRRLSPYVRPYRAYVWIILASRLLQIPIAIAAPLAIKAVIDDATAHGSMHRLYLIAGILAALTIFNILLSAVISYANLLFRLKAFHRIRLGLYRHVQKLSLSYYNQAETGYLMSRQLDDVSALGGVMPDVFAGAAVDTLKALGLGVLLFVLEWRLALGALLFAGLILGFQSLISGPLRQKSRQVRERWSALNEVLHQGLSGHYLVQATVSEVREARRFARALHDSMRARLASDLFGLWTGRGFQLLTAFVQPLIVIAGVFLIVTTDFTIGDLFAFFLYLQQMVGTVSSIAEVNPSMQSSLASLERVYEILDTQPEVKSPANGVATPPLRGGVTFESVSFAYSQDRPMVLRDLSFDVPPRTMVALVGPSGAGKTTLVQLVARFYDPVQGRIMVDGHDIRQLELRSYRRQLGIVPQDIFLFDRTIAENIAYGKPHASQEDIRRATDAANATAFVEALERGFDTPVGERGVRLSGGQRQRLAIARELLRDPAILILDEATSSLDSESEALVQEALLRLLAGRTSFVIAHRLSTVVRADIILVLEEGRVVEQGRHDELLRRRGLYARLYHSQFKKTNAA